jgi:DNA polymerase I-like protein with 3'-5' exonuclease and polymerase domains
MVLVEEDKKQGEVMIVAWLAQEERMKRVFKQGGDIHQFNADNLKCDRGFAKTRTHGWDYGLMPKNEIEAEARTKYFQLYPRILLWQEKVAIEVRKYRVLVNCFGRRRMFFERIGNKLDQEAWAYIPQSSLSDDTKRGELELWLRGEPKLQILNDGHDSVLWQVKESDLEWSIKLAKECLERAFLCGGELLTIPIEIKIGRNWGEMNELG